MLSRHRTSVTLNREFPSFRPSQKLKARTGKTCRHVVCRGLIRAVRVILEVRRSGLRPGPRPWRMHERRRGPEIRPPTRRSFRVMTMLAASWITADFVIESKSGPVFPRYFVGRARIFIRQPCRINEYPGSASDAFVYDRYYKNSRGRLTSETFSRRFKS